MGDFSMSKKDKLITKLKSKPKDFTFSELKTLLSLCGYALKKTGKTGGSRVRFVKGNKRLKMHKPHPHNYLQDYQINELIKKLTEEELI